MKKFFHLLFQARTNVSYVKKFYTSKRPTETSSHYSRGKWSNGIFARTGRRERICRFHIKSTHQEFLWSNLSGQPKNETKSQLSSEKINLPKEPSNNKRKITHQESVRPSKYPRQENIIDPVDNEQFFNDIQKHENHDKAFIEFSQQYGEPWRDDKRLKQHLSQIKDQEIRGRRTRT